MVFLLSLVIVVSFLRIWWSWKWPFLFFFVFKSSLISKLTNSFYPYTTELLMGRLRCLRWIGLLELSLCASSRSAGSENLHTGHGRQFSPFTNCRVHWLQAGLCLQRPHTYMLRRSTSKQTGHLLSRTHAPGWPNLELRQFLAVHLNRR